MPSFAEQLQALHSNPNEQMRMIAQKIDDLQVTGGQGESVADLGNTTDLVAGTPAATVIAVGAALTPALNAVFNDVEVETAMGLKADQADVVAAIAAVVTALDLKVEQSDYSSMVTALETRLAAAEAKIDELLGSLRDSAQIEA